MSAKDVKRISLRRRGGNGERRSSAHGVARSHVAYYIKFRGSFSFSRKERKDRKVFSAAKITVRMKSNPPRRVPRKPPRPFNFSTFQLLNRLRLSSIYSKTYTDPFVPSHHARPQHRRQPSLHCCFLPFDLVNMGYPCDLYAPCQVR